MAAGTPDIKGFFEALDECADCKFTDKFFKYADYLSIAKIEDTQIISGRPVSKNVDFLSDNVGQEFFEVTLGTRDSVTTVVRFTYKQFPPQQTVEQQEFIKIFRASVAHMIAVSRLSAQYSYLYNYDMEFGMYNPNYLFTKFDEMFATGVATKYSVAFINIKQVNQLNRYFGSDIAGTAIKSYANKLKELIDESRGEFAVHLGGDNFIVVIITSRLPELERLITSVPVTLAYGVDKFEYVIKSRAGITTIKTSHRNGKHVMGECSQAYTYSRKNNIDIVYYSDEINEKSHNNTETLTKALNDNKFLIYYQPIISVEDQPHLHAAEALVRWPVDGRIIAPEEFINIATDSGLVTRIDFYVLENVCKNIKNWQSMNIPLVPISINFSGRHLFNNSIANDILAVIDKYEVDHSLIGIEFSEPDFTQRMPILKDVSQTLTDAGVLVTLDKFSTGQSTLNILHDLEANYVKIEADRFEPEDQRGRIITNNMINLANILGYKVICEGVHTQKQVEDLKMCGCLLFQSFFYDKPMSERFFLNRLQNPLYENEEPSGMPAQ
ncbi:EAL domain-containing protein (putative c-di-GMP-specific phosphodiesterase class I) [Ruminococcaceae bacterium R-25]|nr:EAL domain-containing protein (putative c-di-GMP-specific phosphodiesterase class I) [Ruminococcaceae bacterium R-25]SUQ11425.1 EAL domain, c-di-GMP-specific phosphodiesterase class I (or its enzymatically inactive variant) [Oscillospiraceae bacterium]